MIIIVATGYLSLSFMMVGMLAYLSGIDAKDNNIADMQNQPDVAGYIYISGVFLLCIVTYVFRQEKCVWAMIPSAVGSSATVGLFIVQSVLSCGVRCRPYLDKIPQEDISDQAMTNIQPYLVDLIIISSTFVFLILLVSEIQKPDDDMPCICVFFKVCIYTFMYMYMGIFLMGYCALSILSEAEPVSFDTGDNKSTYSNMV